MESLQSPWKKILHFGRKGKLSSRFIGPYEVLERIGSIAYCLALSMELGKIHNFFSCVDYQFDPSHVVSLVEIELRPKMMYSGESVNVLA
ncbi:hypothetical protein EPI10_005804 [Gossypium australe]|uniref:Tf2-1-like SH3-like domain-containing protein n=1 Tax=Gossypium australe TaxID=47621 RepID=A0A5B6WR16_9ROSI|nr:hypothetical protein EPI10_005804 [Gossypium australe]